MKNKLSFLIGLCSNSHDKTNRFLVSLIHATEISKFRDNWGKIVVVRPAQYKEKFLKLSAFIQKKLVSSNIDFLQLRPKISKDIWTNIEIRKSLFGLFGNTQYHIAAQRNRTILAIKEVVGKEPFDLYAILDDDLIFENAILRKQKNRFRQVTDVDFINTFDFFKHLLKIKRYTGKGPVIGGNTGCPPIPPSSAIASMISDKKQSLAGLRRYGKIIQAQFDDYYYDLTEKDTKSSESGYWLPFKYKEKEIAPNLQNMLLGITTSRPLLFDEKRLLSTPMPSFLRGGNTYFDSWEQLSKTPHLSLVANGVSTRRSDMISARLFSESGAKYYQTYFPLGHFRMRENNERITKEAFRSSLIRETFGFVFLRAFNSFVDNKNWRKTWDIKFNRRLYDLEMMFSIVQREMLKSKRLFSLQEIDLVNKLCQWEGINSILVQYDKIFKEQCQLILNQLDNILKCWDREIKRNTQ